MALCVRSLGRLQRGQALDTAPDPVEVLSERLSCPELVPALEGSQNFLVLSPRLPLILRQPFAEIEEAQRAHV